MEETGFLCFNPIVSRSLVHGHVSFSFTSPLFFFSFFFCWGGENLYWEEMSCESAEWLEREKEREGEGERERGSLNRRSTTGKRIRTRRNEASLLEM